MKTRKIDPRVRRLIRDHGEVVVFLWNAGVIDGDANCLKRAVAACGERAVLAYNAMLRS